MLHVHARIHRRCAATSFGAVVVALVALPAVATADTLPVGGVLQTVGSVIGSAPAAPAAPTISAATPCHGAHKRASGNRQSLAIWCLVNRTRARAGLGGFAGNLPLARAASRHAHDMARHRFFGHQRPGGPTLVTRARRAGFAGARVGEAIAYACGSGATPASIVGAWLRSAPHRAILLGGFDKVGISVVKRAPVSCRGATYVLDAGR